VGPARATNHEVEYAFFHDDSGNLTFAQIEQAQFQPYANTLRLGYARGNTWIKVIVNPARDDPDESKSGHSGVLRVGPNYLDHVDLYQRQDGRESILMAGDMASTRQNQCKDDLFCFDVGLSEEQSRTLFLKIQTDGVRWIQIHWINDRELNAQVLDRVARISSALSISVALLILGVFFAIFEPSKLMQCYCLFQLTALLFTFTSTGLMGRMIPQLDPQWVNSFGQMFQVMRIGMTVLLGRMVLKDYDLSPFHLWLTKVMLATCSVSFILIVLGQAHVALMSSYAVFFLNPAIQLYGVTKVKNIDPTLQKILILGYAIYAALVGFGTSVAFDWFPAYTTDASLASVADWRLNGMFVSMFVFWVVLKQQQTHQLKQMSDLQNLRLVGLQTQFSAQQLKERQSLIDLLTHELKNPMGTIRFALEALKRSITPHQSIEIPVQHIQQSVARMDALIEHVAQSNQVDAGNVLSVETIDLGEMIDEFTSEYAYPSVFECTKVEGLSFSCNRQMLSVVVENLLSNAVKYASDGRVQVQADKEYASRSEIDFVSEFLILKVSNQVDSMNMPDESKLFDRYYRHPNVMGIPGLGIGLSLVQSAVERMGGTVSYAVHDHQAQFSVRIPNNLRKQI